MRLTVSAAALLISLTAVPLAARAGDMRVSVRTGTDVRSCADVEVTFDRRPALTAEERLTAPGAQKLTVHASRNGGVYVHGGSRADFAISVCKAVAPSAGAGALDQVRGSMSGGTLTATGPASTDGWVVYFIVEAPAKADVDLDATNGPIQVAGIAGSTTVRAKNGPVKLQDVSGRVSARTENGPIAFEGGSGTVELAAQNGPLAVRLAGSAWTGGSLDARAQNGPVRLQAPRGFTSGVRVRSSQHSPWTCKGCGDSRRTWDDGARTIEIGNGPVAVTLSTDNGPVAVDLTK